MILKKELIERLKSGETLTESYRNGKNNTFHITGERAHAKWAKQLIEAELLSKVVKAWHIEYTWKGDSNG